ncbi:MAG: hypothetical protein JSV91_11850 [Phycisphaerales bacterium]|nr:MAG: hypothetical protein JSV91_11850 [Phycisphaerales bacterium]
MAALREMFVIAALALLTSSSSADAPMIWCTGWVCGGNGPRAYAYHVDSVSYPMMEFRVGANQLGAWPATNVLTPPGWNFAIEDVSMPHYCLSCGDHTHHGVISDGPCWCTTEKSVRWWTDDPDLAVEVFTFGFDHYWPPEDVGWSLLTHREDPPEDYTFTEFWDSPLGMGQGPLHGPCFPLTWCPIHEDCDADEYCFFWECDTDFGWCLPLPVDCPDHWEPVCGCDELTYANACRAAVSGVSIEHTGKCEGFCPEDVNDTGVVDIDDLFQVLGAWGPCDECVEDINADGVVDIDDVFAVLAGWGPCL